MDQEKLESRSSGHSVGWKARLDAIATVVTIVAGLGVVGVLAHDYLTPGRELVNRHQAQVPEEPLAIADAPRMGSAIAKGVLIVYSDFQCPFCRRFAVEVLPHLKTKYFDTGRAQFIFRNVPIETHQYARTAAIAAECAGSQGKFWEAHDLLFGAESGLAGAVQALPSKAGLEGQGFKDCLEGKGKEQVERESELARQFKIATTPTFMIGTLTADGKVAVRRLLFGSRPLAEFEQALEELGKQ